MSGRIFDQIEKGREKAPVLEIDTTEIRVNPLNYASKRADEEELIAAMEKTIKEFGQQEYGVVYEDESDEDDKTYTLISGERRFRAIENLRKKGEHIGIFIAKIIPKPESKIKEELLILQNNIKRADTKEAKKQLVKTLRNIWEEMSKDEKDKEGGNFSEWAGKIYACSPRTIERWLAEAKKDEAKIALEKDMSSETEKEKNKKFNPRQYKNFCEKVLNEKGLKCKIQKNRVIFSYEEGNEVDLFKVIETLNLNGCLDTGKEV